jgi:hypothetical protein
MVARTISFRSSGAARSELVCRDGVVIATRANDSLYADSTGIRCTKAGASNCSNEATVQFGGPLVWGRFLDLIPGHAARGLRSLKAAGFGL